MTTRTGGQPQPSEDLSWRRMWRSAREKWSARVNTLAEKDLESQELQLRQRHGVVAISSAEDQLSELHRWSPDDAVPSINEHCLECDTKRFIHAGILACPKCDLIGETK